MTKSDFTNEFDLEIDGELIIIELDKLDREILIEGLKRGLGEMIAERLEEAKAGLLTRVVNSLYV